MRDPRGSKSFSSSNNDKFRQVAGILRLLLFFATAILTGSLFMAPASAQWAAADLFPASPAPVEAGPHGLEGLGGVIDTSPVLRGLGRLRLQLPGSSMVEMARDGFERRSDGGVTWRGRVTDDEGSRVILTVKDGYMAGRILRGVEEYRIIPGPGRSHVIERLNGSVAPVDEHFEPPVDYSYDIGPVYEPGGYSPNYGNSPDNIQLLVVYSQEALAAAGGGPQIEVRIQSMVDQLNTAFVDSGMIARVALVQTLAVDYSDSGDVRFDLDWLLTRHELINFEIDAQRKFYGADLVSMVVDNGGQCAGAAYVMHTPAYDFVSYAYSVTALNCGGAGLAHEVGHNMGFEHNPEDSARYQAYQPTATPYSFGHYVDGSFRTIMSYATPCLSGCPMAFRFSNPNLDFLGFPTGIVDQRDNAQTGDYTAPIVTDFMDAVTGAVVNRRVSASVEDVEELADGSIVVDSATLELGDGLAGVQAVGLRFQNLNIPVGMRIDSAYLEFEAADIGSDASSLAIRAEAADNASAFSTVPYDVTGRTATTASVQWDLPAWNTVTEKHYSPDISAVIQEVVDRPGWAENNSMVITVGGTGLRTALAYDGVAASAPLLHVEYAATNRPASISAPVAAYSYTCMDLTCSFTDESTDSDGVVIYWSWDFGEGTFSEVQNPPAITFPAPGTYSVSLHVMDDQAWEDYTVKQVSVVVGNSAPVATDDSYTTVEDTPVSGNVLTDGTPDSDVNGDPLTVTSNTNPSNGVVTVAANGDFTYTPNAGYAGTDSFTYTISDGNGGSATGTVTITVRTHVVATDNSYSTNEDTAVSGNVLTDGTPDSDIDGDTLTVTANTNVSHGILTVAANGAFTYTPNADFWGWDDFTYTVSDGAGNSATATVNITIAAVNDPPVVGFVYSCNGLNCSFTGAMTDVDSVVNFSVLWDFGDGTTHNSTTVGNVLHSYPADGTYTVVLAVTDSDGATGTATQTVTVANNSPVAYDKYYQTWYTNLGGNMMTGYVSGGTGTAKYSPDDSDPDGDPLTVVSNTNPSNGVLTVWDTAGNFTYRADSGFYGYDSFAYTVSDGNGATATATVNITVNETPMASFTADCSGQTCSFTDTSIDNLGPISQWDWSFGDGAVSTAQNPSHTYSSRGSYMVTLTVTDVLGDSSTESYSVWIPNAAPVATDNSYGTSEGISLTGNVLTDGTPDSDPDGDALIVMANTSPSNGTVSMAASGAFTYTPNAGFNGTDSFNYTISDGAGGSDTATVTISVVSAGTADIVMAPASYDFGSVLVGTVQTANLAMRNQGDAVLTVSGLSLTGGNPDFTLNGPAVPFDIQPGYQVLVGVDYSPSAADADSAALSVTSNDPDTPSVSVPLSGSGVAGVPDINLASASLDFGDVAVGSTQRGYVDIQNLGTADLNIASMALSGSADFVINSRYAAPFTIKPGRQARIKIEYTPGTAGSASTTLDIVSDDPDEPSISASLGGNGIASPAGNPDINLSSTSLAFGDLTVGSTSRSFIDIQNLGDADLTVTSLTISGSGDFTLDNPPATPFIVKAGRQIRVKVTYTASVSGAAAGSLDIGSDDPDEPTVPVSLSGNGIAGVPDINAASTSLDFGDVEVGTSRSGTVYIQSLGTGELTVTGLSLTGGSGAFQLDTSAPVTVLPGYQVGVNLTYTPGAAGADSGTLTIASDDPDESTVTVALSGNGTNPPAGTPDVNLPTTSIDYGDVLVGATQTASVAIQNLGTEDLNVTGLTVTGSTDFALAAGSSSSFVVLPGRQVTVTLDYKPAAVGPAAGGLSIATDDPDEAALSVSLGGNGVAGTPDINLPALLYDFGDVAVGSGSSTYIAIQNPGTADLSVTNLTLAGNAGMALASNTPTSFVIPAGRQVSVRVDYAPTAEGPVTGSLTIDSDDPDEPSVSVELSGNGVPAV